MAQSSPPRFPANGHNTPAFNSPMLTPSPISQRFILSHCGSGQLHDLFLQSPFESTPLCLPNSVASKLVTHHDRNSVSVPIPSSPSESRLPRPCTKPAQRTPSRESVHGQAAAMDSPRNKRRIDTPLRTPLTIATPKADSNVKNNIALDRLAPLSVPRLGSQQPLTRAETEVHLNRQTDTMTQLRICDLDGVQGRRDHALFCAGISGSDSDVSLAAKGSPKKEIPESISPGGHVNKRRARARHPDEPLIGFSPQELSAPGVADAIDSRGLPPAFRPPQRPATGSSPTFRRRAANYHASKTPASQIAPVSTQSQYQSQSRAPLSRLDSGTLFFGPLIPQPPRSHPQDRINLSRHNHEWGPAPLTAKQSEGVSTPAGLLVSGKSNRSWDEDMFFGIESSVVEESSFLLHVTEGTPPPRLKRKILPKKYKPTASGVVAPDDEEDDTHKALLNATLFPATSTSFSTTGSSDGDMETLLTPGVESDTESGWPTTEWDADVEKSFGSIGEVSDVDKFVLKTLAAGGKVKADGDGVGDVKRPPGTPVKKGKTGFKTVTRPWQSAVSKRIDFGGGFGGRNGKAPRKSLPAAFPIFPTAATTTTVRAQGDDRRAAKSASRNKENVPLLGLGSCGNGGGGVVDTGESDEESVESPSLRKEVRRARSGISLESPVGGGQKPRTARRSGGGVSPRGSQGSDLDWQLLSPRALAELSPTTNVLQLTHRRPLQSPTGTRIAPSLVDSDSDSPMPTPMPRGVKLEGTTRPSSGSWSPESQRAAPLSPAEWPCGRFERDFVEVDKVGSGEFGKVIKVRWKHEGREGEVFAIKKSKRFEGVRHRLRLHEEVDVLKHLSQAAPAGVHPNVLTYIDSWEQDEVLYIRTELCSLGNFARFLWEYGRAFPKLDEARVWKIVVELSNGLRFIHESGVIHLDLKPANIFVTAEGRLKIGDFGMASLWPRMTDEENAVVGRGPGKARAGVFEREGDKMYLAPEVLQGVYGWAADVFSLGMTLLEAASNIVVPDQGEDWHRLRREDFGQVELKEDSPELFELIRSMMRSDPGMRVSAEEVCSHGVVARTKRAMKRRLAEIEVRRRSDGVGAGAGAAMLLVASPLFGESPSFLDEILGRDVHEATADEMDVGG